MHFVHPISGPDKRSVVAFDVTLER
jgi:hypothetical protein